MASAPPVHQLQIIKGESITDIQPLIGNKIIVLELWATWCPPCRQSIPHLTSLAQQYKKRDVVFIGISSESESTVKRFVQQMASKMDYTVAIDTQHCMDVYSQRYNASGIPVAFIIDYQGRVKNDKAFHPLDPQFENALDVAANELKIHKANQGSATTQQSSAANLDLSKASIDEINTHSIKDLKQYMSAHGLDASQCVEKSDMIKLIMGQQNL